MMLPFVCLLSILGVVSADVQPSFYTRDRFLFAMVLPDSLRRRKIVTTGAALLLPAAIGSSAELAQAALDGNSVTSPGGVPSSSDNYSPVIPGLRAPFRPTVLDGSSWSPPPQLTTTKLAQSRILASELSPLGTSLSPFAEQELYYAPFLFGAWNVTATLRRKYYPYGTDPYVPSRSLVEGSPRNRLESVGDTTRYERHFYSTLAKSSTTASSNDLVDFGNSIPKSKIIADRAFDIISTSRAYQQLTPVQEVIWNPNQDPTRLSLKYNMGALTEDLRPLGQRRGEVYILARQSEQLGNDVFCAAERSRSVLVAPGNVVVSDNESITEFRRLDPKTVEAVSRIAVYLTPNPNSREGVLWQEVGGKAVAFYDYELQLNRIEEEALDGVQGEKMACVATPQNARQCVRGFVPPSS